MKTIYKIVIFCILVAAVVLTQGAMAHPWCPMCHDITNNSCNFCDIGFEV